MSEIEEFDPHERAFGVSREVWSLYQKAREDVFRPDRRKSELWIEHWRQMERIADIQIQKRRNLCCLSYRWPCIDFHFQDRLTRRDTLHESIRGELSEFRERIGRALMEGNYDLFNQIAEFLQHGERDDQVLRAPSICSAFHQLLDEYRELPDELKCSITKKALKVRASGIMAAHLVRNDPEDQKARLFEQKYKQILKDTNWAREFNRLGLGDLPEADSGRPRQI
jgi:hypothetical protein